MLKRIGDFFLNIDSWNDVVAVTGFATVCAVGGYVILNAAISSWHMVMYDARAIDSMIKTGVYYVDVTVLGCVKMVSVLFIGGMPLMAIALTFIGFHKLVEFMAWATERVQEIAKDA